MNTIRISRMNYAEMYLKECVYILGIVKLSLMSIIEKVFHFNENQINVVKCNDDIWFKGKDIANALGYENPGKAIRIHMDSDDKMPIDELLMVSKGGVQFGPPSKRGPKSGPPSEINYQRSTIYVNKSGLYTLIFTSKLKSAKVFMKWVTSKVLPSIKKTGSYVMPIDVGHKFNNALTFKIENEMDLHVEVVSFLKKRYPHSLFTVTLGENQDTVHKRINSFNKGYLRGSPDLIINNLHKRHSGFAIEFENPNGKGVLSPDQSMILLQYKNNGFKTLVSNDYDHIIEQVIEYFRDVRIKCSYCPRRFISPQSLRNHIEFFHKRA